jgi:putative colanic acid biosynthesis glycosyltransferase
MNNPDTTYFGWAKIMADGRNSWLYPSGNISTSSIDKWLRHKLPNHQAIFFPKSFYAISRFSLNFVISSDSDYKLRALKGRYAFLDFTVCKFYLGGFSSNYTYENALQQSRDWLRRTSGKGGWFYALDGLMRSPVKVMISKIFGEKAHGVIDKLKRLGRGRSNCTFCDY